MTSGVNIPVHLQFNAQETQQQLSPIVALLDKIGRQAAALPGAGMVDRLAGAGGGGSRWGGGGAGGGPTGFAQRAAGAGFGHARMAGQAFGVVGTGALLAGTGYGAQQAILQGASIEAITRGTPLATTQISAFRRELTDTVTQFGVLNSKATEFFETLSKGGGAGTLQQMQRDVGALASLNVTRLEDADAARQRAVQAQLLGGTLGEQRTQGLVSQSLAFGGLDKRRGEEMAAGIQRIAEAVTTQGGGMPGAMNMNMVGAARMLGALAATGIPGLQGQQGAQVYQGMNQAITSGQSGIYTMLSMQIAQEHPELVPAYAQADKSGYARALAVQRQGLTAASAPYYAQGLLQLPDELRQIMAPQLGIPAPLQHDVLKALTDTRLQDYLGQHPDLQQQINPVAEMYASQALGMQQGGAPTTDIENILKQYYQGIGKGDQDVAKYENKLGHQLTGEDVVKAIAAEGPNKAPMGEYQGQARDLTRVQNDLVNAGDNFRGAVTGAAHAADDLTRALGGLGAHLPAALQQAGAYSSTMGGVLGGLGGFALGRGLLGRLGGGLAGGVPGGGSIAAGIPAGGAMAQPSAVALGLPEAAGGGEAAAGAAAAGAASRGGFIGAAGRAVGAVYLAGAAADVLEDPRGKDMRNPFNQTGASLSSTQAWTRTAHWSDLVDPWGYVGGADYQQTWLSHARQTVEGAPGKALGWLGGHLPWSHGGQQHAANLVAPNGTIDTRRAERLGYRDYTPAGSAGSATYGNQNTNTLQAQQITTQALTLVGNQALAIRDDAQVKFNPDSSHQLARDIADEMKRQTGGSSGAGLGSVAPGVTGPTTLRPANTPGGAAPSLGQYTPGDRTSFWKAASPLAQYIERQTGFPADQTLAIMGNESNFGSLPGYSFFGMTGQGSQGSRTFTSANGQSVNLAQYGSPQESADAFIKTLQSSRYAGAKDVTDLARHGYVQPDQFGEWVNNIRDVTQQVDRVVPGVNDLPPQQPATAPPAGPTPAAAAAAAAAATPTPPSTTAAPTTGLTTPNTMRPASGITWPGAATGVVPSLITHSNGTASSAFYPPYGGPQGGDVAGSTGNVVHSDLRYDSVMSQLDAAAGARSQTVRVTGSVTVNTPTGSYEVPLTPDVSGAYGDAQTGAVAYSH
jgi:hypothetical protein